MNSITCDILIGFSLWFLRGRRGFAVGFPSVVLYSSGREEVQTLRTLIFARHLFSRVHIFAAYIFAPEAPGVNFSLCLNFRLAVIFVFFLQSNFRACLHAHKYSHKFDMFITIHTEFLTLFSCVVIFKNYNRAKINVLKVF